MKTIQFIHPKNSDTEEFYTGYVLGEIKRIITIENHIHKWQGVEILLDILIEAIELKGLDIIVTYTDGHWNFTCKEEEYSKLPSIIPVFKRLYRFQKNKRDL